MFLHVLSFSVFVVRRPLRHDVPAAAGETKHGVTRADKSEQWNHKWYADFSCLELSVIRSLIILKCSLSLLFICYCKFIFTTTLTTLGYRFDMISK